MTSIVPPPNTKLYCILLKLYNDLMMLSMTRSMIFIISGPPFLLKQLVIWDSFQSSGNFPFAIVLFTSLVKCGKICCFEANIIPRATLE